MSLFVAPVIHGGRGRIQIKVPPFRPTTTAAAPRVAVKWVVKPEWLLLLSKLLVGKLNFSPGTSQRALQLKYTE